MKFNKITPEKAEHLKTLPTPIVPIVGQDGNAFGIMGRFSKSAKKMGWIKENIDLVLDEMKSGDYNHLLVVTMEFSQESEEDDGNGIGDEDYEPPQGGCDGDDL